LRDIAGPLMVPVIMQYAMIREQVEAIVQDSNAADSLT
jgi:hypothetical protein